MTFEWSEWGLPLVIAAIGLVLGVLYARGARGTDQEQADTLAEGRREDLMRTKDSTLEALRALEIERPKLDPADYEEQRQALLARGAGALEELDRDAPKAPAASQLGSAEARAILEAQRPILGDAVVDAALSALATQTTPVRTATPPPAKTAPPAPPALSPAWQGAGWAIGAVLVVGGLWWLAQGESVTRREGASMTGNQDLGGGGPPPEEASMASFPNQAEMEARLAANPDDIEALNALTEAAIGEQDLGKAMAYNSRVRELDPKNLDARVHFAFLRLVIGQFDQAIADLDGVLVDDPHHAKAHAYKGLFLLRAGRAEEAVPSLEAAIAEGAPGREALEQELLRAKMMASGDIPTPSMDAPRPAPAPAPSSGGGEVLVSGTITAPPDAASGLDGSEIVYVSLRDPAGGPPVAALRLPPGPFPMTFEVTSSNVIAMGGARPIPGVMDLTVRIDTDGNPMTRLDAEPAYSLKAVAKGTTGIAAALQ